MVILYHRQAIPTILIQPLVIPTMSEFQTVTTANKTYSYSKARYTRADRSDNRRSSTPKKTWQVAELWDNHHEIARRLLLGQKSVDIARDMDITPAQVSNVKNSPVVQEKLVLMRAARDAGSVDLAKEIMDLAPIALERIKEALSSGTVLGKEVSASQLLKESNGILDREMGKAVQRVDTRGIHAVLSMDDIERIKQKAIELAGVSGQLGE